MKRTEVLLIGVDQKVLVVEIGAVPKGVFPIIRYRVRKAQ